MYRNLKLTRDVDDLNSKTRKDAHAVKLNKGPVGRNRQVADHKVSCPSHTTTQPIWDLVAIERKHMTLTSILADLGSAGGLCYLGPRSMGATVYGPSPLPSRHALFRAIIAF
jgi:hypothetical protein